MKNYYYLDDINEVRGPLPLAELDALHKARKIMANTQVCIEGTENWIPFFQVVRPALPRQKMIKKEEAVEVTKQEITPIADLREVAKDMAPSSSLLGSFLLVAGLAIVGYFFLIFDATVEGGELRVNNLGLLNDKQNGIIVGGILAIVGAIMGSDRRK